MNVYQIAIIKMTEMIGSVIVKKLGMKYNVPYEEAIEYLDMSEVKVRVSLCDKRVVIPLPWCSSVVDYNCSALRLNHGLYTQCMNKTSDKMCPTCCGAAIKNPNGRPTYGYVSERMEKGDKWREPKGKGPVNYGNVMDKLKISRQDAEREAENQGLKIPENQFSIKKGQRGRPKKETSAVDTSESEGENPKKTRGRPKKEKEIVSTMDSKIEELVKEANQESIEQVRVATTDTSGEEEEEEKEEETEVTKFKHNDVDYLLAADGTLYDPTTWEAVGLWDSENKKVNEIKEDED